MISRRTFLKTAAASAPLFLSARVLGMEGPGLPEKWRERAVAIPMAGEVESLNAATAAAIALYVWSQSRH